MIRYKIECKDVKVPDKPSITSGDYETVPVISLGYNFFNTKNREKLDIVKTLPKSQQNVHLCVNRFSLHVVASEKDGSVQTLFHRDILKNDGPAPSIEAFELWEILKEFKVAGEKMSVLCLADDPSEILRTIMAYRKPKKNDLYCYISGDNVTCTQHGTLKLGGKESVSSKASITVLKKEFQQKVRDTTQKNAPTLVVGTIRSESEQDLYTSLVGQTATALSVLNEGGSYIIWLHDTYTPVTVKLIMLLSTAFKETFVYKPSCSPENEPYKYLVCVGFQAKQGTNLKKLIIGILEKVQKLPENEFITDIAPDMSIPPPCVGQIVACNYAVMRSEYRVINKMYEFLKSKNFYGVEYHKYIEDQLKNGKEWVQKYISE